MIRSARFRLLLLSFALVLPTAYAAAQSASSPHARAARAPAKKKKAPSDQPASDKPNLVGTYGPWGAYVTTGRDPTCYVLSQPQQRAPATLKRDPAYVFISTRPAEHVRDEISIVMGFDVKDDASTPAGAQIGSASFDMVSKGTDLWLADDSQDPAMIAAMKKGSEMTVKASSTRGNETTDTYSLSGLTQALAHTLGSCK